MAMMLSRSKTEPVSTPPAARPSASALRDLAAVALFVWLSAWVVHALDLPEALAGWNQSHEQWAVDEVTLISVCAVAALGFFSWRRWRESQRVITRYEATLQRLRTTEGQVALKDHLINTVSHELKTPLTAVIGYAQLLGNDRVDPDERKAMVDRIIAEGWDLTNIVEDLLTRAQAESENLSVASVPVFLAAQAAQVTETLNPGDRERVRILTQEPVRAVADPARVRQIVRNLLSNAIRYGGPHIAVEAEERSGLARLRVLDDGSGVPPGDRDLIFNPYHRAHNGNQTPGSIGLGLSISRELAQRMGGDLTYQRRRGHSVFELSLPLAAKRDT
jgi:signal transduction histidine kinase